MTTFCPHWPRLVPAALFSAAVTLGTVGYPAIASATWDIEAYDDCMIISHDVAFCCDISGGVVFTDKKSGNISCGTPAAAQGEPGTSKPPKAGIPTALVQPPDVGTPPVKAGILTALVQPPDAGTPPVG